jgi:hypothetical protein
MIGYLNTAKQQSESVDTVLLAFASAADGALYPPSPELSSFIKKMNDDIVEAIPGLIKTCTYKISSLESELSAMRLADYNYHKSLESFEEES